MDAGATGAMAKGAAALAALVGLSAPAAAGDVAALLAEPAVASRIAGAFGERQVAFLAAMVDPRVFGNRGPCPVRSEAGLRSAVCGVYGRDPYGAGFVVVGEGAGTFLAGYALDGAYVLRASEDWVETRPDAVSAVMNEFAATLPEGVTGRING